MNYAYDLLCNFSNREEYIDSYEWKMTDVICVVEKIPIFYISSLELQDIISSTIQVSKEFLNQIYQKTNTNFGIISFACLVTDFRSVVALKFQNDGREIGKCSLLFDEESAIVEESINLNLEDFSYKIIDKNNNLYNLTRKERKIRKYLLLSLKKIYELELYDELEYLYFEIFSERVDESKMYELLIDNVEHSFSKKHQDLYQIIQMASSRDCLISLV